MKIMREDRTGKMNPETAIEIIQDMFCDGCQFSDDGCIDCIWYLVKEALEKQIPKEPKEITGNERGYCKITVCRKRVHYDNKPTTYTSKGV